MNTLVIMAAGFGSRYKGGIKQMTGVGPNGEWIMDYTIYDAYQAGIRKVVLIIREELKEWMENHFHNLPSDLELQLVYQKLEDLPDGFSFPERTKPWGTGQAILCCKEVLKEPFIVVNADDYYGNHVFDSVNTFFNQKTNDFCMAGFYLKNTLSEHGGVNRGICEVDEDLNLVGIEETYQIVKNEDMVKGIQQGHEVHLDLDAYCSLNLWGFTPTILNDLERQFIEFLTQLKDVSTEEFLLPDVVKSLLKEKKVRVLPTNDEWFGMTYQEDKSYVEQKIALYSKEGKYPVPLWK